jgi:hypothetical protein
MTLIIILIAQVRELGLSRQIRERAMEVTAARNPGVSEAALANYLKRGKKRRP